MNMYGTLHLYHPVTLHGKPLLPEATTILCKMSAPLLPSQTIPAPTTEFGARQWTPPSFLPFPYSVVNSGPPTLSTNAKRTFQSHQYILTDHKLLSETSVQLLTATVVEDTNKGKFRPLILISTDHHQHLENFPSHCS